MSSYKSFVKSLKIFALFSGGNIGFLCYYLPNKTCLDEVLRVTSSYREKDPVPVSKNVKLLFNEVMDDMKLSEEDKQNIQLYTCWKLDFYYAGSIWKSILFSNFEKAIIGVPQYFNWDKLSEEIKEKFVFRSEKLDWSSKHAKKLENSMFTSDKAKKFALAQNLFYVSSFEPLYNGLITAGFTMLSLQFVLMTLNSKRFQDKRFKALKYSTIAASIALHYVLWLLFKDMYRCYLENKADEAVAQLGKEYIEGGLEYYDSILERNVALRDMVPIKGFWAPFTLFGNEQGSIRQKHLPLSGRRDYFKKLLRKEKNLDCKEKRSRLLLQSYLRLVPAFRLKEDF